MAVYIDYLEDLDYFRWETTLWFMSPFNMKSEHQWAFRQLQQLFLDHHKERIQVLWIPITHLELYKAFVPHLRNLQRIRFYDDMLDGTHDQDQDQDHDHENENADGAARNAPVYNPMPGALAFIQSHRALFNPSRVPERLHRYGYQRPRRKQHPCGYGLLEIEPPFGWINATEFPTYDAWYVQLLQALESPAVINFENWTRFSFHLDNIPLDGVKRLRSFCDDMPEANWDQGKLLQRCRALERFSATVRSPTVFSWAVEEQKYRATCESLLQGNVACAPTGLAQGRDHGGYFGPGLDPVPLRKVTFRNGDDTFVVPVLKDICSAFRKTLESIRVQLRSAEGEIPLGIVYGMHHLTVLDMHINFSSHFSSSTSFLEDCTALEFLRLVDEDRSDWGSTATKNTLQEPWRLPKLRALVLIGAICDAFNYESLAHAPEVETIRLERFIGDIGVRKVSERYLDHLSRPSWSWNWSLPRLYSMTLQGLPAHLFRPCLLKGCPKLQKLHLDLGKVPRSVSKSRDLKDGPLEFQSPVRSLVLKGQWIMMETPNLFRILMQTWFNGLHYLKIDASQFPSKKSIMNGLTSLKRLCKANLPRHQLSSYEVWELGLREVGFKCSREWDLKHRVQILKTDAQERRRLTREQQHQEEARELERAKMLLEFQESFELMSTAFSMLDAMEDSDTPPDHDAEEQHDEQLISLKEISRCETVDSTCAIYQDQEGESVAQREQAEQEAVEEQEAEEEDDVDFMRCVYVFKGRRFHATY
ncbi:hypothetical protein BGX24_003851 [Mortierella sp. AD032]|nr:hypothetical protein BGX24_003851 [Mortierella sp. AD032]